MTEHSHGCGASDGDESAMAAYCAEVIAEVWLLLDGECTPETKARLQQHLEECPRCLRRYGVEEQIKALIARKCSGEKAPQNLVERVRLEISRTTIIRYG